MRLFQGMRLGVFCALVLASRVYCQSPDPSSGSGVTPAAVTSSSNTAASTSLATPQTRVEKQAHIAQLIDQLGDRNYHRRVAAQWALQELGLAAFEQLRAATKSKNIQIANAADYIIQSQNIVWWLETDSVDVRSFLNDYGALDEDDRNDRIRQLEAANSADALLALCRVARYERHDFLSKEAALALLSNVSDRDIVPSDVQQSIYAAIGNSDRTSIHWIRLMLRDLESPKQQAPASWQALAEAEHSHQDPDDLGKHRAQLRRFYQWIAEWITRYQGREPALDVVRASLSLVDSSPQSMKEYALWALDENLPELLQNLADEQPLAFQFSGELGYLLAESYLKLGEQDRAEELATEAHNRIGKPPEDAVELSARIKVRGMLAGLRFQQAQQLTFRGQFRWAEREYQQALQEEIDSRLESRIRDAFAMFYWFSGMHQEAADVLNPLVERLTQESPLETSRLRREVQPDFLLASYHFYRGLAHVDRNELAEAHSELKKAYERDPSNPDIVIAMRLTVTDESTREYYERCFERMRDTFRQHVVNAEEDLAIASRDHQRSTQSRLATSCNQLAWLLSKCETHTEEALRLSERSLELNPDDPTYLDTFARCWFAAGEFDRAVETQKRAVKLAPHERQLAAQLAEFEAAAAKARSTDDNVSSDAPRGVEQP